MVNDSTYDNVPLATRLEGRYVVADTSSLLMEGTGLLAKIRDCYLVIPDVVVQELENKRTDQRIGFLARDWLRLIEEIRAENGIAISTGVSLEEYDEVTLIIEPNHSSQKSLPIHLQTGSVDSTILAVAKNLQKEDKNVVVLSNDVPMRIHATLCKMEAYEVNATTFDKAPVEPFTGHYSVEITEEEYIATNAPQSDEKAAIRKLETLIFDKLPDNFAESAAIEVMLEGDDEPLYNLIVRNGELSKIERKRAASGIKARTLEQDIALEYLYAPPEDVSIVSLAGRAGSGKTLLTVAVGIQELKAGNYQKVIVFRSLHEMGAGQEMGFLPGGVNEKMEAWAGAIYDALDVIAEKKKPGRKNSNENTLKAAQQDEAKKLKELIEVSPITYLRGRSLAKTYLVIEEAQNFSRKELLNILSRVGEGSKIVFTFDAAQVDNRFLQSGSKADIWSVVDSLKNEELFAHITLMKTERSRVADIASRILESN